MDFEQQKPITDEYRAEWDRVFGYGRPIVHLSDGRFAVSMNAITYPNGCPILSEEKNG